MKISRRVKRIIEIVKGQKEWYGKLNNNEIAEIQSKGLFHSAKSNKYLVVENLNNLN